MVGENTVLDWGFPGKAPHKKSNFENASLFLLLILPYYGKESSKYQWERRTRRRGFVVCTRGKADENNCCFRRVKGLTVIILRAIAFGMHSGRH